MEPLAELQRAKLALDNRSFPEVERILALLLREFPQLPEALRMRALALQQAGQLTAAVEAHRHALSIHAAWAEEWNDLGICLAQLQRLPEATEAFQRGVMLKPEHVGLACNLARGWALLGRRQDAERALLNAIRLPCHLTSDPVCSACTGWNPSVEISGENLRLQ